MKIIDIGVYLPKERACVITESKEGRYSSLELEFNKYKTIAIENELYPLEMAYESILSLKNNGVLNDLSFLIHNAFHYNGYSYYHSPTCWLQNKLNIPETIGLNVNHGCNGLMSVFMACNILRNEKNKSILCTFSERFNISSFSRWYVDYNVIYADGACSVIISNDEAQASLANILAIEHFTTPELEGLVRLDVSDLEHTFDPHDMRSTKRSFIRDKKSIDEIQKISANAIHSLLNKIKVSLNLVDKIEVDHLILPNFGHKTLHNDYLPHLPKPKKTNSIDWGLTLGHVGSSDCFIRLKNLIDNKETVAKDRILILSLGAGVTWTMALLEMN